MVSNLTVCETTSFKLLLLGIKPFKCYLITVYPLYADGQGSGQSVKAYLKQDRKYKIITLKYVHSPFLTNKKGNLYFNADCVMKNCLVLEGQVTSFIFCYHPFFFFTVFEN